MLSWNLNNIENEITSIICLSIFIFLALLVTVILILLSIHKSIYQTLAKSMDLVNSLLNTPIKNLLVRIELIAGNSGLLAKELRVWRTKYELLLEKKLLSQIKILNGFMDDKKNLLPSLGNYKKIKDIYSLLTQLDQTIFDLQLEIKSHLEIEYILRNRIIEHSDLFRHIKKETQLLDIQESEINREKIAELLENIDNIFDRFFDQIYVGNYNECQEMIKNLSKGGYYLIDLMDSIPYFLNAVNSVIPSRMQKLKDENIIFSNYDQNKIKNISNKFSILQEVIDELRSNLKKQILKFQYSKANAIHDKINNQIKMFELWAQSEERTKDFFETHLKDINGLFDKIKTAIWKINSLISKGISLKVSTPKEVKDFRDVEVKFFKIMANVDQKMSSLDFSFDNVEFSISSLKNDFTEILKETLKIMGDLENAARFAEKLNVNNDKLTDTVVFAFSILNQCEVKIKQFKNTIVELPQFQSNIDLKLHELTKIKQEISEIRNKEDKTILESKLNTLFNEIDKIHSEINDNIFKDFIAQELIVYIQRFTNEYPNLEFNLQEISSYFMNRQLDQSISYSIDILKQIKTSR